MSDGAYIRQLKDRVSELEAALRTINEGSPQPWITELVERTLEDTVVETEVTAEEMLPAKE